MSTRSVVTGATGLLGSHLCEALVAQGDRVTALEQQLGLVCEHLHRPAETRMVIVQLEDSHGQASRSQWGCLVSGGSRSRSRARSSANIGCSRSIASGGTPPLRKVRRRIRSRNR